MRMEWNNQGTMLKVKSPETVQAESDREPLQFMIHVEPENNKELSELGA